ncbi:MAG: LuxR C-terminal-related transcriptional regulator, partial [Gaiellaceae bacterium]
RLERATEGSRQLDRIAVLFLLVRAGAAANRVDAAVEAAVDLDRLAGTIDTSAARAAAAHAGGESALAGGDLELARRRLEDAVDLYGLCEAPYEQARARLALARVLFKLELADRARAEARKARDGFLELDARRDLAAATRLLEPAQAAVGAASPLTRRERQVLAFMTAGRSNREIASELVVSQHTVHRHVANILRKLGEPTRAAAAARATREGLV